MTDVTFLLIAKFDSIERIENAILVMDYLTRHYETKIVLWEVGSYQSHLIDNFLTDEITYSFHEDLDPILHRTAYLNEMVKQSATDFVAIWDLDIIIRPSQVFESVKLLMDLWYIIPSFFSPTEMVIIHTTIRPQIHKVKSPKTMWLALS